MLAQCGKMSVSGIRAAALEQLSLSICLSPFVCLSLCPGVISLRFHSHLSMSLSVFRSLNVSIISKCVQILFRYAVYGPTPLYVNNQTHIGSRFFTVLDKYILHTCDVM